MSDTMPPQIWLNPPSDGWRFSVALLLGVAIEGAALLALLPMVTHHEAPSDQAAPVKLSIISPAPVPKPPAPKPVPTPPKPVAPPQPPLPLAPPMPPPPPIARPAQHVIHHYVKPRVQTPPPVIPPPVMQTPPTPTPPAAPAAPTGGQIDLFQADIKRAVQSVVDQVYPQAAQMAHEIGTPSVTFTYLDGRVTNIELAQSSGFPLLDQAALQAARIAPYPAPPPGFAGRSYQITIAVIFELAAPSVDGD
ncbi:MAG: energy transducer TonB [Acidocella sp.]|nr:energy transducer TonB [Acidocella sp.]